MGGLHSEITHLKWWSTHLDKFWKTDLKTICRKQLVIGTSLSRCINVVVIKNDSTIMSAMKLTKQYLIKKKRQ